MISALINQVLFEIISISSPLLYLHQQWKDKRKALLSTTGYHLKNFTASNKRDIEPQKPTEIIQFNK